MQHQMQQAVTPKQKAALKESLRAPDHSLSNNKAEPGLDVASSSWLSLLSLSDSLTGPEAPKPATAAHQRSDDERSADSAHVLTVAYSNDADA